MKEKLYIRIKVRLYKLINRIGLNNRDFTIVSNNCWGGFMYQKFGLKYNTPFIGLFIYAPDYIRMLNDLERYMNEKLNFISPENSKYKIQMIKNNNFGTYPIAKLDDIELHFLHYKNDNEARNKWEKRVKRINYKNMLIKFSDSDLCNESLIKEFNKLKFKNKICFTSKPYKYKNNIYIKECKENGYVEHEWTYTDKYINIKYILNNLR